MSTSAYAGVLKWSGRDEWRERFNLLLNDHLDATWDHLGVETQEELVELIGEDRFNLAYSTAFEDLLSRVSSGGRGAGLPRSSRAASAAVHRSS